MAHLASIRVPAPRKTRQNMSAAAAAERQAKRKELEVLMLARGYTPIELAIDCMRANPAQAKRQLFTPGPGLEDIDNVRTKFSIFVTEALDISIGPPIKTLAADSILCKAILPVIGRRINDEANTIQYHCKQQCKTYTPKTISDFSFQKYAKPYFDEAPILHYILRNFVLMREPQEEEFSQPPPSSTTEGGDHNSKKILMVTMVIAVLMYARNRRCNLVQGQIGYFLAASNTHKRTIAVLNSLGISISYDAINAIQNSLATAARETYRLRAASSPFVISFDNMNYCASVKTHLLNKTPIMHSDTAGYVYFPPNKHHGSPRNKNPGPLKREEALNASKTPTINAFDILPRGNLGYYRDAAIVHVSHILMKYFPDIEKAMLAKDPTAKKPIVAPINQLPVRKTEIYTLPTLELNEALITDVIEILKELISELDVDPETLLDKVILFKGDYLTVRNINLAMYQRQDSAFINKAEALDFCEPIIGLFHLAMNVQQMMCQLYWGNPDGKEPGTLCHYANLVRNNRVKAKADDFRATQSFMSDVLDGHVIGNVLEITDQKTWKDLETLAANSAKSSTMAGQVKVNWKRVIQDVVDPLYDMSVIQRMREREEGERDYPRENAHLFLRDMLVMRDYEDATRSGDSGRLIKAIQFWCILYQGSPGKKNYPNELIHFVASIKKLWKEPMIEQWLQSCIVNPSGRAGGWLACDLFCEWVIRENKARIHPSSNALSDDHNRNVHSLQAMSYLASRENMRVTTGATNYYQNSKLADSKAHVRKFAENNSTVKLFCRVAGRVKNSNSADKVSYKPINDLYQKGSAAVLSGVPIKKYKAKSRVNWATFTFGQSLAEEDDNLDELQELVDFEVDDDIDTIL